MHWRSRSLRKVVALLVATSACAGSGTSTRKTSTAVGSAPVSSSTAAQLEAALADTLSAAGRIYRVHEVVRRAVALGGQVTPPWSRAVEGCAQLRYVLSAAGDVEPTTVVVTEGSTPALAEGVLHVLPGWRYRPATGPSGSPVRQLVNLVVLKRGPQVILAHDRDLLPGDCPRPEV